jgi:hypothetical protein
MTGIGEDTSAQLEMLIMAHIDLRKKDPGHELLALVELHPDSRGFNTTDAYMQRCVRESDQWAVQGYARYTHAMEQATWGIPYRLLDTDPACEF